MSKMTLQNNTPCKTKNEEMYSNFADLHDKDKLSSCFLNSPGRFAILNSSNAWMFVRVYLQRHTQYFIFIAVVQQNLCVCSDTLVAICVH